MGQKDVLMKAFQLRDSEVREMHFTTEDDETRSRKKLLAGSCGMGMCSAQQARSQRDALDEWQQLHDSETEEMDGKPRIVLELLFG